MNFKVTSIKRSVTSLVILVTTVSVTLACLVLSFGFISETYQSAISQTNRISRVVAENSSSYLVYNQAEQANRWLATLSHEPLIEHVHLYRLDTASESLSFFASYYATGQSPIPVRFERVATLDSAQLTDNYIEVAVPMYAQNQLLGYVYIRTARKDLDDAVLYAVGMSVAIIIASLILSWLLSFWLRRIITRPLDKMIENIQLVARDKTYEHVLPHFELQELERLADAFNTLLLRIQQHISRQAHAEQTASELNTELERQVQERTQQLRESNQELFLALESAHQYQSELVQAEKMSSLAKLVAGVAHEVNTPVGLAVTSTSILQEKLQSLEQKFSNKTLTSQEFQRYMESFDENLSLISRNIARTADLISNFSKLSMDQFSDDDRSLDLNQFWDDIAQSLSNRHPELADIELSASLPEQLVVKTRPGPLNQILSQLVQNAIQHAFVDTNRAEIRFEFAFIAQAEDSDQGELIIDYRDNGDGIPKDLIKSVFDPFVTSKRGHGAAGLGLHLLYNLVVQVLQGHIDLESESQQGTHIAIRFPVKRM